MKNTINKNSVEKNSTPVINNNSNIVSRLSKKTKLITTALVLSSATLVGTYHVTKEKYASDELVELMKKFSVDPQY